MVTYKCAIDLFLKKAFFKIRWNFFFDFSFYRLHEIKSFQIFFGGLHFLLSHISKQYLTKYFFLEYVLYIKLQKLQPTFRRELYILEQQVLGKKYITAI